MCVNDPRNTDSDGCPATLLIDGVEGGRPGVLVLRALRRELARRAKRRRRGNGGAEDLCERGEPPLVKRAGLLYGCFVGGRGTNSGTSYQARVAAYLAAYLLAGRRLPDWIRRPLVPTALLFEQGGAGDDIRITAASNAPSVEVQVKRGLKATADLAEVFQRFVDQLRQDELGLLVVDRTSASVIREKLRIELKRWGDGLPMNLPPNIAARLNMLTTPAGEMLRGRLDIVMLDVAEVDSSDSLVAYHVLETVVADARLAYRVLAEDAHQAASIGTRRDKQILEQELARAGIELITRSPTSNADSPLVAQSPMAMLNKLLQRDMPAAALELAQTIEPSSDVPESRLRTVRAAALIALGKAQEAAALLEPVVREFPKYVAASAHMVTAKDLLGEHQEAAQLASELLANAPDDPTAWAVYLHYSDDSPPRSPPKQLEEVPDVVLGYAVGLWRRGAPREALNALTAIEATLQSDPGRHFLLAQVTRAAGDACPQERQQLLTRAFEIAANVVDSLTEASSVALVSPATMFAALVLEELERWDESRAWFERALRYSPSKASAAIHLAQIELTRNGSPQKAIELLSSVPDSNARAVVMALRARALRQTGTTEEARAEVERAIAALPKTPPTHRVETAIAIADAALEIGIPEIARRALQIENPDADLRWVMLRARAEAALGNDATARVHYARAVELAHPDALDRVRLEFAAHLRRVGDEQLAVSVLEHSPTARITPLLVSLLMSLREMKRAEDLARDYAECTPSPEWALRVMSTVANARGDQDGAAEWLARWFAQTNSPEAGQHLARVLLELDRTEQAVETLHALSQQELSPEERLRVAWLIAKAGNTSRALELGYSAVHEDPHVEEVQLGWILLFLTCSQRQQRDEGPKGGLAEPAAAAEGVFVSLKYVGQDQPAHGILIGSTDTIQPAIDEVDPRDALARAVCDKQVGDVVELRGGPAPLRAQIVELRNKYQHAFQWAARTYSRLHPDSTAFREYSVVNDRGEYDFSSMHALAKAVAEQHEALRSLYLGHQLVSLGLLAQAAEIAIVEMYDSMIAADPPRVWVEATPALAGAPTEPPRTVVLSLSALRTLQYADCRDVLDAIGASVLITPTTFDWLRTETRRLEEGALRGTKSIAWRDGEPTKVEVSPEDISRALQAHSEFVEWCSRQHRMPRPYDWERERASSTAWKMMDLNSFECALLAREQGAVLLADDLGLRALASRDYSVANASTFRLAMLARESGRISQERFDAVCRRLHALGHWYIPVTESMLSASLEEAGEKASTEYRRLLAHLRDPHVLPDVAARLTASALRRLILAASTPSTDEAIEVTLEAYFSTRNREDARRRLRRDVDRQFRFIPFDAERCVNIVEHFLHVRM